MVYALRRRAHPARAGRALSSTWRDELPARRLYLNRGWQALQDELDESSSLLGIDLRILR